MPNAAYAKDMKQYTSAEMAQKTGMVERTIRKAAAANDGIGRKVGRDWIFTDADIAKIKAVVGKPRKRTQPQPEAPTP